MTDALLALMQDLSEKYYHAGWLAYLEFDLWGMVIGEPHGLDDLTPSEIAEVAPTWVPMAAWRELFRADRKRALTRRLASMIFPGRAPTFEEIATNAVVEGCMAAFYPQMGGYCGKCWVRSSDNGDNGEPPCFEVAVYHDGEFPFEGGNPIILHHCSAEQFSRFGELCGAFLGDPRKRS